MQEAGSHAGSGRTFSLRAICISLYAQDMHLTQTALDELRELLRRELGENVTDTELLECAVRIARFVQLMLRRRAKRHRGK